MVGNKVFYALTDGYLYSRTLTGGVWGTAVQINPYHDPVWATVSNHLGGTFDGNLPTIYGQIPSLTGMVYSNGRLYYTLSGDPALRWRCGTSTARPRPATRRSLQETAAPCDSGVAGHVP